MPEPVDLDVALPRAKAAPGVARRALRSRYAGRLDGDVLADAELMASELAANALVHGAGEIRLRASLDADRLLVEVVDEGSGFEHELRRERFAAIGGWGLEIVEDVSSRWGVHEGTTHVWFEVELAGPRLGKPES